MRYYKFVINGVENVKSFKNSDSPPEVGVFQYGEHKVEISECSYKENIVSGVEGRIDTPILYHGS